MFILASCFDKKHIKDWWWFRIGLYAYVASIVTYILRYPGSSMYTIWSFVNYGTVRVVVSALTFAGAYHSG